MPFFRKNKTSVLKSSRVMMRAKPTVVVLFGGNSFEHVVSCDSARAVSANLHSCDYELRLIGISQSGHWYLQNYQQFQQQIRVDERQPLNTSIYPDTDNFLAELELTGRPKSEIVFFPVLHGNNGEDGRMQGLFELSGFPYIGASLLGSALANDKAVAKSIVRSEELTVVPSVSFFYPHWQHDSSTYRQRIAAELSYPLYIKPASTGSSIGIRKIAAVSELDAAVQYAASYSDKILVEQSINAQEIECAVIGDLAPVAAPMLGEITPLTGFYDYHAKYIDSSTVEITVPARISGALADQVRKSAVQIFRCLQLHGMARIDFFVDKESQNLYFNEVNTIPGFTDISLFPVMWAKSGMDSRWLFGKLLEFAISRYQRADVSHDRSNVNVTPQLGS